MNMQTRGVTAHVRSLKRAAGVAVKLRRGGRTSAEITGIPATNTHTVMDEETGIPTKIKAIDWLFEAVDLVLAGETIRPLPGDVIERVSDAKQFTVAPLAGRPAVEPYDQFEIALTVHTKAP